jgi:hypothetical protein
MKTAQDVFHEEINVRVQPLLEVLVWNDPKTRVTSLEMWALLAQDGKSKQHQ